MIKLVLELLVCLWVFALLVMLIRGVLTWYVVRRDSRVDRLVRDYVEVGTRWGKNEGFHSFLRAPWTHRRDREKLERLEAQYIALGYQPLSDDDWIDIGALGYSAKRLLYVKIGEQPYSLSGRVEEDLRQIIEKSCEEEKATGA